MSWCCFLSDNDDEADSCLERKGTSLSLRRSLRGSSSFAAAANNLTKIFEELKCPICFNVCVPPIHNCVNGHIVCDNCRQKGNVTICPTCRESLMGARNYFAENFILNYAQQCRYASQGCEHLRLKGCNMKPHEEKCMFRPVKCIVAQCGLEIPYKNFLGHLDYAHKVSGTTKLPSPVQFKYTSSKRSKKIKWLPYYIQAFGNVYYVMMQRVKKNFWLWVYSQTSKEGDELEFNHFTHIKLNHPDKKISYSWHGPVYSIRSPFKLIMKEGCCFMLPDIIMKNFVSQGMLNFTVDIRKHARRTLKDVKPPGVDSGTAIASSLPVEYTRPPSFYEPHLPTSPLVTLPTPTTPGQLLDENGNINVNLPEAPPKPGKEVAMRNKLRTAAIGIPGGFVASPETETSSITTEVTTTNAFEIPPAEMSFRNDEEGMQEKIFVDKVPSQSDL